MDHHHLSAQLKQLLKRGYSLDDIRRQISAPAGQLDLAIQNYLSEQSSEARTLSSQQHQAFYAMRLR